MLVNFKRREELREKSKHPQDVATCYLCVSHSEHLMLKGPYIIGFEDVGNAERYSNDYKNKGYNVAVTFSYPFEISELWDKKKK